MIWLHSGTWQCCPRASVKPELSAGCVNDEHEMPRGSISNENEIDNIGEVGGSVCTRRGDFVGPRTPIFEKNIYMEFSLLYYFRARYLFMNAAPNQGIINTIVAT